METLDTIINYDQVSQTGDSGGDARRKLNRNFTKIKTAVDALEAENKDKAEQLENMHNIDGGNA